MFGSAPPAPRENQQNATKWCRRRLIPPRIKLNRFGRFRMENLLPPILFCFVCLARLPARLPIAVCRSSLTASWSLAKSRFAAIRAWLEIDPWQPEDGRSIRLLELDSQPLERCPG